MTMTLHLTYATDSGLQQYSVGTTDIAEAEQILAHDDCIFATLVDDETQTRRVLRGGEILKESLS